MSMRLLAVRIFKNGRNVLHSYWKRDIHSNFPEEKRMRIQKLPLNGFVNEQKTFAKCTLKAANAQLESSVSHHTAGIYRFGRQARKLFVDSILKHVTTTYSAGLRRQAIKKLFYGDSAPLFALIGVSLASGSGILSKEDELECVCWEIREAANRSQNSWSYDDIIEKYRTFSIKDLIIGQPIAKGSSGVVYAAALKTDKENRVIETETDKCSSTIDSCHSKGLAPLGEQKNSSNQLQHKQESIPLQNISRFVHSLCSSVDNLHLFSQPSPTAFTGERKFNESESIANNNTDNDSSRDPQHTELDAEALKAKNITDECYPLALKMIFNYDTQSNALAILQAMYRETIPARIRTIPEVSKAWKQYLQHEIAVVPPHANIVCMYGFFCDEVGNFPDGHQLYPDAQPQRLHPEGCGRNMSLYLLMRRYDYTLREYLNLREQQLTIRMKLLLFAQLLEGVAHINRHGVAHRDLKSDNLLIEMNSDECLPSLVLTDFGSCLADRKHGLQIPFNTFDIVRGGNPALMAPEIINKQPGPFSVLNYSKSDLWTCGTIAYEIFGMPNPFYQRQLNEKKENSEYKLSDLPSLPDECPFVVQQLIYNILTPNPSKRLTPVVAANVMQLFLWAPSQWLKSGTTPNSNEILQWLLSLSTKIICDMPSASMRNLNPKVSAQHQQQQRYGRRTLVEYSLICSFLCRVQLPRIRSALNWIQSVIET